MRKSIKKVEIPPLGESQLCFNRDIKISTTNLR